VIRARFPVACVLILGSGCSLIYSSDLDGARTSATVADGGNSRESGASTSSSSGEAGADGGAGQDPPTRGCASYSPAPNFCDDFDVSQNSVGLGWDNVNQEGGPIVLDGTTFWSGTHAAKVSLATSKSCQYTRLERVLAPAGRDRFETRFMMRPARPWSSNATPLALNIEQKSSGTECQPLLSTTKDGKGGISGTDFNVQTKGGATNDDHDLTGVPPVDDWSEVVVAFQTNGGHGLDFAVTVGGATDRFTFAECPSSWDAVRLNVGFHCDSGSNVVDYDDVRATWDGP